MPTAARIPVVAGALGLILTVINQLSADEVDPSLQRAGVVAAILSVVLMLVGLLWSRITPVVAERAELSGTEGLVFAPALPEPLRRELGWGSSLVLTATPAASLLLLWDQSTLLRRGLLAEGSSFSPGAICQRCLQTGKAISLVDLKLYPGREEFDDLLPGLPSVVVQPIGSRGLLLVGGWSARCFSRSDLTWLEGWAQRLTAEWAPLLDAAVAVAVAPADSAPGTD
ncbi:MAG: cofactor assembly of complex C subunit B [Cyanobium sp.]